MMGRATMEPSYVASNFKRAGDLELALIDANGVHAICFPCRRVLGGWIKAEMKTRINVRPTHWRDWAKDSYKAGFKPMDAAPAQ
jgi:hypothetical protein